MMLYLFKNASLSCMSSGKPENGDFSVGHTRSASASATPLKFHHFLISIHFMTIADRRKVNNMSNKCHVTNDDVKSQHTV